MPPPPLRENPCISLDCTPLSVHDHTHIVQQEVLQHTVCCHNTGWGAQATSTQLLITYCIRTYGALLFATVQTTRQVFQPH